MVDEGIGLAVLLEPVTVMVDAAMDAIDRIQHKGQCLCFQIDQLIRTDWIRLILGLSADEHLQSLY